jgi:chaperonin GroEL
MITTEAMIADAPDEGGAAGGMPGGMPPGMDMGGMGGMM